MNIHTMQGTIRNTKTGEVTLTNEGTLSLRNYQKDAVNAFYQQVANGHKSGVICAPTGSGKSVMIAEVARKYATEGKKVLIITHRKELIEQDDALFRKHCPNIKTGIISAMIKRKEFNRQVTFSGIMTVIRNLDKLPVVDLIIIDEAHRVNTEKDTSYAKTLDYLKKKNPNLVILGLSATPYRMGTGLIYEGEDRLFDCLYYNITMKELIENGYLCEVIARGSKLNIDLSKVHTKMGDYDAKELEKAANNDELTHHAVMEIRKYGATRKSWIIFCCGIAHAYAVQKELTLCGITSEVITGKTKVAERERILNAFKDGSLKCVVNVGVLTEGFDSPQIDLTCLLTSTQSKSRMIQMIGRGMRVCEGKRDCLLLDFGHNVERLGLIDSLDIPDTEAPMFYGKRSTVKKCPKCQTYLPINASKCKNCGHEFISIGMPVNHSKTSYNGKLMSSPVRPKNSKEGWFSIVSATYSVHQKEDRPRTYRCMYTLSNGETISKFLSLDEGAKAFARRKSIEYIKLLGGTATTIEEAQGESFNWRVPSELFVRLNKGFLDIERIKFSKSK